MNNNNKSKQNEQLMMGSQNKMNLNNYWLVNKQQP